MDTILMVSGDGSDMITNLVFPVIIAIVGAVVGGFFTLFAVRLQNKRKVVSYEVTSMSLLRFKPLGNTLAVSVDKFVISGDPADKGKFENVDTAYGFEVSIFNSGNEDIEKPNIEVKLDKQAKVIGYEIQPASSPGYSIDIQKDAVNSNILRILLPFINRDSKVIIRIISTDNANKECNINIMGLGIKTVKRNTMVRQLTPMITIFPAMICLIILVLLPDSVKLSMGGYRQSNVQPPIWLSGVLVVAIIMSAVYYVVYILFVARTRKGPTEMEWDEGYK